MKYVICMDSLYMPRNGCDWLEMNRNTIEKLKRFDTREEAEDFAASNCALGGVFCEIESNHRNFEGK